jgi:hypothetical protein
MVRTLFGVTGFLFSPFPLLPAGHGCRKNCCKIKRKDVKKIYIIEASQSCPIRVV